MIHLRMGRGKEQGGYCKLTQQGKNIHSFIENPP